MLRSILDLVHLLRCSHPRFLTSFNQLIQGLPLNHLPPGWPSCVILLPLDLSILCKWPCPRHQTFYGAKWISLLIQFSLLLVFPLTVAVNFTRRFFSGRFFTQQIILFQSAADRVQVSIPYITPPLKTILCRRSFIYLTKIFCSFQNILGLRLLYMLSLT